MGCPSSLNVGNSESIEHSGESGDDYAWFAAIRTEYDLVKGGDNASVRARQALFELEELVRADFNFDLQDLNGSTVKLGPARGVLTVVSFWASWCAPCVEELPMLTRVERASGGRVRVAGLTEEDAATVKAFIERNAPGFNALLDRDRIVFRRYGIDAMPSLIIVDDTGRVRFRSGPINQAELQQTLSRLGMN